MFGSPTNANTNTNANKNLNNGMIVTMEGKKISHSGSGGGVNSPITFTEADAELLFAKFRGMEPDRAETFATHHLVILMVDLKGKRGTTRVNYKSLHDASKAMAIQRNPNGQIYFALQLNAFAHLSLGPTLCKELSKVVSVERIPSDKNHNSEYLCVWNKDNEGSTFIADTSDLIRAMIPSISKVMKKPTKGNSRGTIAVNIGISTNDCGQYRDNRYTIFGNIKPFFIKDEKIDEEGKTLLGRLVVYVCKNILPQMNHGNHFKLGCSDTNTPEDEERENLRREFGRQLNVGDADLPFFLIEGISVLLPTVVRPHKDVKNDSHPDFNGSVCINCTVPLSSIKSKNIRKFLISIGYSDDVPVPCCIVLYSRKVCRQYFNLRNAIANLQQNRDQAVVKVVADAMLDTRGDRDYIGNTFDAADAMGELEKKLQSSDQDYVAVPSAYDPMSKLSILLDYAFEYHCCVGDLDARGALGYILFIVLQQEVNITMIAKIMKCILSRDAVMESSLRKNRSGLYHRMTSIAQHLNVLSDEQMNDHELRWNMEKLMTWFDDTRITIHGQTGNKDFIVDKACRALLLKIKQSGKDGIRGIAIGVEKGKLFIKLASLLGLIPLRCMTWAGVVSAEDKLSRALRQFDGLSEVGNLQKEEFDSLVTAIQKNISSQATGPVIESMLLNHAAPVGINDGKNCAEDYHFCHSHGDQNQKKLQNFYRVKLEKDWELQILSGKKSTTLTEWKSKSNSFLCWTLNENRKMVLDSTLIMPNEMWKHFSRPKFGRSAHIHPTTSSKANLHKSKPSKKRKNRVI